jgi:hypothetical protein
LLLREFVKLRQEHERAREEQGEKLDGEGGDSYLPLPAIPYVSVGISPYPGRYERYHLYHG